MKRLAGLAFAIGVLAVVGWQFPLRELSPAAVVPVAVVLLCALIPRTAISLACGAIFGAWAGATWALTAALIAATITYALGHWAGREVLLAKTSGSERLAGGRFALGPRITALDGWLARRGVLAVVVVRLLPIAPYGLVGYAYGASSVRFRDYFLGTAIGAAPSAMSYATIGAAAVAPQAMSWLTFLPAAIGVLISTTAALYWRQSARSGRQRQPVEQAQA